MSDEIKNEVLEEKNPEVVEPEVEPEQPEVVQPDEVEQPEEPEKPSESVPLAKFMDEKKKRKELERILQEKQTLEEQQNRKVQEYQTFVQRGYPEQEAWNLANDKVNREFEDRKAREKYESKLFDLEIKDLVKNDAFYSDAESFKDEIKEKMRKLDCSMQDAYMLVRGPSRAREYQMQQEQRAKAQQAQSKTRKLETPSATPLKSNTANT